MSAVLPPRSVSPLERAMALGVSMLEAAREGDWTAVDSMSHQIDTLAREPHESDEHSRQSLRGLLQQQGEVIALASLARDAVAEQLSRHRQKHRAVSAYLAPGQIQSK